MQFFIQESMAAWAKPFLISVQQKSKMFALCMYLYLISALPIDLLSWQKSRSGSS
jgi:hypothetical protein